MHGFNNYNQLHSWIIRISPQWTVSGIHGALSAAFACEHNSNPQLLIDMEMLPDFRKITENNKDVISWFDELISSTSYQLSSTEFEYQLVLPGDETDMQTRLEALIEWCDAFTMTIALLGEKIQLDDQSTELMNAISNIQAANPNRLEELPNEDDFEDICEYVRMGVIHIHTLHHTDNTKQTDKGSSD